jgi:drug/metabolite transporter (DMT)-like permease
LSSHADTGLGRAGLQDWLLLGTLVVLWGSAFALTEIALGGFSPLQVVTGRLWIGALVLVALMTVSRQAWPRGRRTWIHLVTMSLLGNVLPFLLISWGQQTISSGLTGILMAVMPLVVLLMAHFMLPGERLDLPRVAGFLLGFTGIVLLTGPSVLAGLGGDASEILAQLSVLAGAVCYGMNLIVARRGPTLPPAQVAGCVLLVAALLATTATIATGDTMPARLRAGETAALLGLGLMSTGLATVIYYRVVARAGATFLSLINYLIPVYAVLAGAAFLGERLPIRSLVALGVILSGIVVSQGRGMAGRD